MVESQVVRRMLPDPRVNKVWMWAGLLAGALGVMLQSLTGLDHQAHAPGRVRIATLRHRLLDVPGRLPVTPAP